MRQSEIYTIISVAGPLSVICTPTHFLQRSIKSLIFYIFARIWRSRVGRQEALQLTSNELLYRIIIVPGTSTSSTVPTTRVHQPTIPHRTKHQ